jgi:carbamate kinase
MTTAATTKGITVIAMGGNSLIDPALPPTVENQFEVTRRAVMPIATLLARGERLVITHGNGPQVGFMQLRSEISAGQIHEVPLDSLVADSQGAIGYMIELSLREELARQGATVEVGSLVTEVEVDPADPAFQKPTKPVGKFYPKPEAEERMKERGWQMVEDVKRGGWRRVVPSPIPTAIVQLELIRKMVDLGATVICCGGGGIPVGKRKDGKTRGVEAVIDKDRTSAVLAVALGAERLVITTAIDAVYKGFNSDSPVRYSNMTLAEIRALAAAGEFPPGSMGPKIEAAAHFLEQGGKSVLICHTDQLAEAMEGKTGTVITKG